jgi:uncharacterized membrane protein YqiK
LVNGTRHAALPKIASTSDCRRWQDPFGALRDDRGELPRRINEILAGSDLARIGMDVDVLKIAGISDANGYLTSLGQRPSPR